MKTRKRFRTTGISIAIAAAFVILATTTYFSGVPVGAQLSPNFIASTVTGSINTNSGTPGTEAFWNQVPAVQVPLSSSNDVGGATKSVSVKMANNGTHLMIWAQWSAPVSSRLGKTTIEDPNYPALFYANSSYSYDDRIVFWWSLNQTPGPPPCMQKACTSGGPGCIDSSGKGHGEGEALAGTGNLWHWKSARTDSLGSSYGKLKIGSGPNSGQLLIPPHSYADNEFINTTGHYQLGYDQYPTASVPGNFTIGYAENNIPYNTFVVYAQGVYDSNAHMYRWEASRSLHTTPTLHMVQFNPGATYYFAVGVWDGGPLPIPAAVPHPAGWTTYGENEETKSISTWNTMALSPVAPGGQTSTISTTSSAPAPGGGSTVTTTVAASGQSTGIDFSTAAVAAFAMLVVGFVAGVGIISRFARPKQ